MSLTLRLGYYSQVNLSKIIPRILLLKKTLPLHNATPVSVLRVKMEMGIELYLFLIIKISCRAGDESSEREE